MSSIVIVLLIRDVVDSVLSYTKRMFRRFDSKVLMSILKSIFTSRNPALPILAPRAELCL